MTETPEQKLKIMLQSEQQHFEAMVNPSDLDILKSKILKDVSEQERANVKPIKTKVPAWFATAATVVLSVSILWYTQFNPSQLELLTQADLAGESRFLSTLTEDQILSLGAVHMSSDPNDPLITLLHPQSLENIESPFKLEITFSAAPKSKIVEESFKLVYGLSDVDVTKRIVESTNIEADKLTINNLVLPAGTHRFKAIIEDSNGRESQAIYTFKVN